MPHTLKLSLLALFALTTTACLFGDSLTVEIIPRKASAALARGAQARVILYEYDLWVADLPAKIAGEEIFELSGDQRGALLEKRSFEIELDDISRSEELSYYATVEIDVDGDGEYESCPDYYSGAPDLDWDSERVGVWIDACPED